MLAFERWERRKPTLRAILIALILIPFNAYWIIQMERVRAGPYPTSISLFANAVFILAILLGLNALLRKVWPRRALRPLELLIVYSMLSVASGCAGMDFLQCLMQILGHAYHFATPENKWEVLFFRYLPTWLVVTDREALVRYHEGHSTLYLPENYGPWLKPCLAWLAFIAALLLVMLCINLIVRKQWMDKERLTFPVVHLPLTMAADARGFFRNRIMWAGFAIAFGIGVLNGLNFLFPTVPAIPVKHTDLRPYITAKPWTAVGWLPVAFYPFAIGLGFLLPIDLLFSCWFFYLFWKGQRVLANALAWDVNPEVPYISQQSLGACFGLTLYLLYISRGHLREVWRGCWGILGEGRDRKGEKGEEKGHLGQETETTAYRLAVLGLVGGGIFLVAFSRAAQMSWWMIPLFFTVYFTICFTVTRMRAELGPPVHDFHLMGPDLMITRSVGTENIGGHDLGMLALYWWFNRAYRSHPMPHQIEGLKITHQLQERSAAMIVGILLAGVVGSAAAMWAFLHLGYDLGTAAKFWSGAGYGWQNFGMLRTWLEVPSEPDHVASGAILGGFLFSLFLLAMRLRFLGWPFHPIGYAISGSWSINLVWMCLFISWLVKLILVRYGGLKLYRRALPLFLGLILGDCLSGSLWSLIGIVLGIPTYSFWGA